jgi:hypothetical protein
LESLGFSNWHFGHFIIDALQTKRKVGVKEKKMGVLLNYKRDLAFCQFKGDFHILCAFSAPLDFSFLAKVYGRYQFDFIIDFF